MATQPDLPAGGFSEWFRRARLALLDESDVDVPCAGCVACCASSHFVHVGPRETRSLARIPRELLFPAPGLPEGTMVMGYDERGRCPMLVDTGCSIYEDRPLTCRTYDCRVFAAAGIDADTDLITERAQRWRFGYPTQADRDLHEAVRAAATFIRGHGENLAGGASALDPPGVALLAVKVCEVFGAPSERPRTGPAASDAESIRAIADANGRFEGGAG